jgi:hypothetical protein
MYTYSHVADDHDLQAAHSFRVFEKKENEENPQIEGKGSGKCILFAASALHVIVRLGCTVAPVKSTPCSAPLAKLSCHRV